MKNKTLTVCLLALGCASAPAHSCILEYGIGGEPGPDWKGKGEIRCGSQGELPVILEFQGGPAYMPSTYLFDRKTASFSKELPPARYRGTYTRVESSDDYKDNGSGVTVSLKGINNIMNAGPFTSVTIRERKVEKKQKDPAQPDWVSDLQPGRVSWASVAMKGGPSRGSGGRRVTLYYSDERSCSLEAHYAPGDKGAARYSITTASGAFCAAAQGGLLTTSSTAGGLLKYQVAGPDAKIRDTGVLANFEHGILGSYRQSCRNIVFSMGTLSADCVGPKASHTTLTLPCPDDKHTIENINGILECR